MTVDDSLRVFLDDLRYKLAIVNDEVSEITKRHQEELAPILARHESELTPALARQSLIADTVKGVSKLYPHYQNIFFVEQEPSEENLSLVLPKDNQALFNEVHPSDNRQKVEENIALDKPQGRFIVRQAIISTLKESGEFLTTQEVYEIVVKNYPREDIPRTRIQIGLRDARRAQDIIGIPVTTLDSGIQTYVHGLKDYLNDPENPKTIKETYYEKLLLKLPKLGYTITGVTDQGSSN
jgi:hypothetical protein